MANRKFNARLARQVFLYGTFGTQVFKHLAVTKRPSQIRWISDRNAILNRDDGLLYDLAHVIFLLFYNTPLDRRDGDILLLDKPKLVHEIPAKKRAAPLQRADPLA